MNDDKSKSFIDDLHSAKERIQRDMSKELERNTRAIITEFFEVLDNLDRALESAESGQDSQAVIEGVFMVREMFTSKLLGFGVTQIDAVGKKFDARLHEAVKVIPSPDPRVDGRIVRVVREGYQIGDDLLRPSLVEVAKDEVD